MCVSKRAISGLTLVALIALSSTDGRSNDEPSSATAKNARIKKLEALVKLAEDALAQEISNDSKASAEILKQVATTAKDLAQGSADEVNVDSLLSNASMEDGADSPDGWSTGQNVPSVTYLWDRANAKSGKASLCMTKTENSYFPIAEWNQVIDCQPKHKAIKIKAQVKAANAGKAVVDVLFLDEKSEWVSHEWASFIGAKTARDKAATHNWKEYSGTVKIPPKAKKIQIGLQMYGPGKVWFDDVKAEYVD